MSSFYRYDTSGRITAAGTGALRPPPLEGETEVEISDELAAEIRANGLEAYTHAGLLSRPAPVPESCTNDQARLALIQFGVMPDAVDAVIDSIADPIRRARLQTLWHYRQTFRRDNADLQEMASALGIREHLDDVIRLAVTL